MDRQPSLSAVEASAVAPLLYDHSTGLALEALLLEHLRLAGARVQRGAGKGGVLFVDLDGLTAVAKEMGQMAVDLVLGELASRVRSAIRRTDVAARSGSNVVIFCNDVLGPPVAEEIARRVLSRVSESPVRLAGRALWLPVKVGLALLVEESAPEDLIAAARVASSRAAPGTLSW